MNGPRLRLVASLLIAACAVLTAACSHATTPSALPNTLAPESSLQPNAGGFKVIYTFKTIPDAMSPAAGMIAVNGSLYGTSQVGGQGSAGTVFSSSLGGREKVLHSFGGASDGVFLFSGLTWLNGMFYGTTSSGGSGYGTVFKMDKSGNESVIYAFKGGNDGAAPYTSLTAVKGVLYGTTSVGGGNNAYCSQGCGTVFSVTTKGKERVIYRFKSGTTDGFGPYGSLLALHGQLYGTTADGGANAEGTIYTVSKAGIERVIYSFGTNLNDGSEPEAGLVAVGGKLYGTTNTGGAHFKGTVFVTTTAGSENVLYSFKGGGDGESSEANLLYYKGMLYGTTTIGGTPNQGTVFKMTLSGGEHVLRALQGSDGSNPRAPLVAVNGMLYGTTSLGGKNSVGTIFRVSP